MTRRRNVARFPIAFAAAGAALALAAGIALYVRSGKDRTDDLMPVASVVAPPGDFVVPSAPSASVAEQTLAPAHPGVEVNEIDAPSRGISVFEIPLAAAAELAKQSHSSSVVIWVEDDPSEAK